MISQESIAVGYEKALDIVAGRRISSANLYPVWCKLDRVCKYLCQQAALELSETLS